MGVIGAGGLQRSEGAHWVHSMRMHWERLSCEPVGETVVGKEEENGAVGRRRANSIDRRQSKV